MQFKEKLFKKEALVLRQISVDQKKYIKYLTLIIEK